MKTQIELKFLGGLESYLSNKLKNVVSLEIESDEVTFENLIAYIRNNIIVERKDVFCEYVIDGDFSKKCKVVVDGVEEASGFNLMDKAKIKPGIIILVNECDWEILDTYSYKIKNEDKICFLSTLHGG